MAIFWFRMACFMMLLAVALGAFGAHALRDVLDAERKSVFEVGVRYQAYHALGLFIVAWLSVSFPSRADSVAGWCFLLGILLFSGSLYALSLTGVKHWGLITPLGGLLFLGGWGCLLLSTFSIQAGWSQG